MCRFIESIRVVDGVAQNLKYHQNRVDLVLNKFYKNSYINLIDTIKEILVPNSLGVQKLRIVFSNSVDEVSINSYLPQKISTLKLLVDDEIDYSCKFENRDRLNDLFEKRGSADNILIVKNGEITDTSYSNVVFWDGTKWITPKNPLLNGTMRAKLLESSEIIEERITPSDLHKFSKIRMINALMPLESSPDILIKNIF
jgi:4-amino-4-deoxychorismate lyase